MTKKDVVKQAQAEIEETDRKMKAESAKLFRRAFAKGLKLDDEKRPD